MLSTRLSRSIALSATLVFSLIATTAHGQAIQTIDDYNNSLIQVGVSWKAGHSPYYPSYYTGFAPRVEDPNRIHFRLARGNQARLTAPLDEQTVLTYLYNLQMRAHTYASIAHTGLIAPLAHKQVDSFQALVDSPNYSVAPSIDAFEAKKMSREAFYAASLEALKALNPGRVFALRFDFAKIALNWRASTLKALSTAAGSTDAATIAKYIAKNPKDSIVAANDLLFGRINATYLSDAQAKQLATLAAAGLDDASFVKATVAFFTDVTQGRYEFRVVDGGKYRQALECASTANCTLVYNEFTAIYPVGSVLAKTSDRDGNSINLIREVGVLKFVARSYHDVDHIRTEQFYGWIPKMDYTNSGNAIHNPAVRTYLKSSKYKWLYDTLGIPKTDDTMWIVSRGGVSHGCTRMPAGHLLEVRNIFPSNPKAMTEVRYTGSSSADYDLFDINGDGQLEVMGVQYYVAYKLVSNDGDGYREANGLIDESFKRDEFLAQLYGNKQYSSSGSQYFFSNPYVSYFSGSPKDERQKAFSRQLTGDFPLFEQAYEKDKLQLFDLPTLKVSTLAGDSNNNTNKAAQLVRLFGRINGCGPFASEFKRCNQAGFEGEMGSLISKLK